MTDTTSPTLSEALALPICQCGTQTVHASGIGAFCPNRLCPIGDGPFGVDLRQISQPDSGWRPIETVGDAIDQLNEAWGHVTIGMSRREVFDAGWAAGFDAAGHVAPAPLDLAVDDEPKLSDILNQLDTWWVAKVAYEASPSGRKWEDCDKGHQLHFRRMAAAIVAEATRRHETQAQERLTSGYEHPPGAQDGPASSAPNPDDEPRPVEPAGEDDMAPTVAEMRQWYAWAREWSGSAFLAGETSNSDPEAKGQLYSDLCRLGNYFAAWEYALAAPNPHAALIEALKHADEIVDTLARARRPHGYVLTTVLPLDKELEAYLQARGDDFSPAARPHPTNPSDAQP